MNVIDEIKKMKEDFRLAKTPEALAEMDKRMADLVASKTETERKELAEVFVSEGKSTLKAARELSEYVSIKRQIDEISDIVSLSYISRHYFNKSRHWLYHRLKGTLVNGKIMRFSDEERQQLSDALADIGRKIQKTAKSIA